MSLAPLRILGNWRVGIAVAVDWNTKAAAVGSVGRKVVESMSVEPHEGFDVEVSKPIEAFRNIYLTAEWYLSAQ